jgi:DNA recombination-dependent growth factor C
MSARALERYRRLVRELCLARVIAPGGELSQDEEATRAEELADCRDEMTKEEQDQLEEELRQGTLVAVRLRDPVLQRLDRAIALVCTRHGVRTTRQQVIREALDRHLEQMEQEQDRKVKK